jgi:hypothetical protein
MNAVDNLFARRASIVLDLYQIPYDYGMLQEVAMTARQVVISDAVCEMISDRYNLKPLVLNKVILDAMMLLAIRQQYSEEEVETDVYKEVPNGDAVNAMITAHLFEKWNVKEAEINFNGIF